LDLIIWSLANLAEFSKELKAEKPAEVCMRHITYHEAIALPLDLFCCIFFFSPSQEDRTTLPKAAVKIHPKTPQTAVTVAIASADIPPRAMSDDNDNIALLDGRQSKKETPVVLLDKYSSFADVFLEEKAS